MAKKRRRKKKYRNATVADTYHGRNRHHILWRRSKWVKNQWASKLRSHPAMIVEMDANDHRLIHERMDGVPIPSETACKDAYEAIDEIWQRGAINEQTWLEMRLSVLICIFSYAEQPTAEALEKQLEIVREIRGG